MINSPDFKYKIYLILRIRYLILRINYIIKIFVLICFHTLEVNIDW